MTLPLLRLAEIPDTAARENAERLYGVARALRDRLAVPQSVTRSLLKRLMTEAFGGSDADGRWSMRASSYALEAAQVSDTPVPAHAPYPDLEPASYFAVNPSFARDLHAQQGV